MTEVQTKLPPPVSPADWNGAAKVGPGRATVIAVTSRGQLLGRDRRPIDCSGLSPLADMTAATPAELQRVIPRIKVPQGLLCCGRIQRDVSGRTRVLFEVYKGQDNKGATLTYPHRLWFHPADGTWLLIGP